MKMSSDFNVNADNIFNSNNVTVVTNFFFVAGELTLGLASRS